MSAKGAAAWAERVRLSSVESLVAARQAPSGFRRELVSAILRHVGGMTAPRCIEVGSAAGITSAMLPSTFQKTLFDVSAEVLAKAREFFDAIGESAVVVCGDILDPPQPQGRYDIVFSAGLLEHFNRDERSIATLNMLRMMAPGGRCFLAVPNHDSIPYRLGYLYQVATGRWPFPKEYMVSGLERELEIPQGVRFVEQLVLDKITIFQYLPSLLRKPMQALDQIMRFEGYLKVFVFEKCLQAGVPRVEP